MKEGRSTRMDALILTLTYMSVIKYSRLCEPCSLCHNYSTVSLYHGSSLRLYVNEWMWLGFSKIYLQKQAAGQIWLLLWMIRLF